MNPALREAISLINQGRKNDANVILRRILDDEPENADAWYLFAVAAPTREYAIRHLRKALSFNPAHGKANAALIRLTREPKAAAEPPRPRRRLLAFALIVFLITLAVVVVAALVANDVISLGALAPSADEAPAVVDLLPGTIVYHESFEAAAEWQWAIDHQEEGSVAVRDGALHFTLSEPDVLLWNYNNTRQFADGIFEVDVFQGAGTPLDEAAFLLRINEDAGDYYGFLVSGEGYVAALYCERWCEDGVETPLALTTLAGVNTGESATNHLRVVAEGQHFTYYVNDVLAGEFTHAGRTEGRVGMYAAIAERAASLTELTFDNLTVRHLP
jgi:hypothetical protein